MSFTVIMTLHKPPSHPVHFYNIVWLRPRLLELLLSKGMHCSRVEEVQTFQCLIIHFMQLLRTWTCEVYYKMHLKVSLQKNLFLNRKHSALIAAEKICISLYFRNSSIFPPVFQTWLVQSVRKPCVFFLSKAVPLCWILEKNVLFSCSHFEKIVFF